MALKLGKKKTIACMILLFFFLIMYLSGALKFTGNASVKYPAAGESL